MSINTQYIIQYEGPFGKDELTEQIKDFQDLPRSFEFKQFGYDTIIGETKNDEDEGVVKVAQKSSPIQILMRREGGFWEELWNIKDKR